MKYTAEEVRARFEAWVSTQSWVKATLGLCRVHDAYSDPCINSRWQGWQAAYAERIEADESAVPVAWISHFHIVGLPEKDYYGKLPVQSLQPGVYSHTPLFDHPSAQVAHPPGGVLRAIDQADTALCMAGLSESDIFRVELKQAREVIATMRTAEPVAQGESAWLERLKDPATVHALMLRGVIAVPSVRSMVDLRGEVPNGEDVQLLRIAELQEQLAAKPAQSVDVDSWTGEIECCDAKGFWLILADDCPFVPGQKVTITAALQEKGNG